MQFPYSKSAFLVKPESALARAKQLRKYRLLEIAIYAAKVGQNLLHSVPEHLTLFLASVRPMYLILVLGDESSLSTRGAFTSLYFVQLLRIASLFRELLIFAPLIFAAWSALTHQAAASSRSCKGTFSFRRGRALWNCEGGQDRPTGTHHQGVVLPFQDSAYTAESRFVYSL